MTTATRRLILFMLLLASGTLASAAEPGGLNPPRPSGFAGLPESVIASVFAATTPSGKMLGPQQIRPLILHMPLPKKPVGVVGYVRLKIGVFLLTVASDGTVSKVEKLQSNGQPILDAEVIRHLKKWRFRPGSIAEIRVPTYFNFQ